MKVMNLIVKYDNRIVIERSMTDSEICAIENSGE